MCTYDKQWVVFINPILCQISKSGLVTFLELFDKTRVIIYVLITVGEIKCLTLKTNLWDAFLSSKAVKDLNCRVLVSYVLLKVASDIQTSSDIVAYLGTKDFEYGILRDFFPSQYFVILEIVIHILLSDVRI